MAKDNFEISGVEPMDSWKNEDEVIAQDFPKHPVKEEIDNEAIHAVGIPDIPEDILEEIKEGKKMGNNEWSFLTIVYGDHGVGKRTIVDGLVKAGYKEIDAIAASDAPITRGTKITVFEEDRGTVDFVITKASKGDNKILEVLRYEDAEAISKKATELGYMVKLIKMMAPIEDTATILSANNDNDTVRKLMLESLLAGELY